jgi:hypothetical protein
MAQTAGAATAGGGGGGGDSRNLSVFNNTFTPTHPGRMVFGVRARLRRVYTYLHGVMYLEARRESFPLEVGSPHHHRPTSRAARRKGAGWVPRQRRERPPRPAAHPTRQRAVVRVLTRYRKGSR